MSERRLWFVRRKETVQGPFVSSQITRNILLGRLRPDDELSPDQQNWKPVSRYRDLYPEVMQSDNVNQEELELARVQADERQAKQRRHKKKMANERRRAKERRGGESDVMLQHRQRRNELDEANKNNLKRPRLPVFSIVLMLLVVLILGMALNQEQAETISDCHVLPAKGVNWSGCEFVNLNIDNQDMSAAMLQDVSMTQSSLMGVKLAGANMAYIELSGSDLSYADLEGARLIGADLKSTDLSYANLKSADLSYADLSQSKLGGADLSNAMLDNAIWVDGQVCRKGSLGKCERNSP